MSVMASRPPNMPAGAGALKRPRLSLQTKAISNGAPPARPASRGFSLNPSDPTAFNTLSNAYVTAIERTSMPITLQSPSVPLATITNFQAISLSSPDGFKPTTTTEHASSAATYPETPISAHTSSPKAMFPLPSILSPTPPMSAGPVENGCNVFSFSPRDAAAGRQSLERALHAAAASASTTPWSPVATPPQSRQATYQRPVSTSPPPYTHAKALHSILRNSPLPSRPDQDPSLSSKQQRPDRTVRIQEQRRTAKRVCYHSPIEQEITTNKYTKCHIDLLVEEASPRSLSPSQHQPHQLDIPRAFTANEIQDGGQTPGPFADAHKRLGAATATRRSSLQISPGGIRKTRREKKRRWVWTIGREEDADEDEQQLGGAVVAAANIALATVAAVPVLTVSQPNNTNSTTAATESVDVEMS